MTDFDERKKQAVGILQAAAQEIPGTPATRNFQGLIDGNKPELALRMFEEAGEDNPVSRSYWTQLMAAAEMLGLRQMRLEFSRKFRRSVERVG